tara:strand:- start:150 stop:1034 length:885 start_codon:yes stop_codon:yes gene_type:complete
MDTDCLNYRLTDKERDEFEENGFIVVEDVLSPQMVKDLTKQVDRVDTDYRNAMGLGPCEVLELIDFVGRDDLFLELLDWPRTFPKVWEILGWNLQLYTSHMNITPPVPPESRGVKKRLGWHIDTGNLDMEPEIDPRPRISLKVGYFLTDTSELGRGNLWVVPGSHQHNELELPPDAVSDPPNAVGVQAEAGSALFFDRRLCHAASPNHSDITRKMVFYGYSYRWLRQRDNMTVDHVMHRCSPIRQQLLGAPSLPASPFGNRGGDAGSGFTSPNLEAVPLRSWIRDHLGEEAVVP